MPDQKLWPQSVQKRAWRNAMAPQPGQLLCVLAMSNPHSEQKRPPGFPVPQFGHACADRSLAWAASSSALLARSRAAFF
jgi:hypothetical protein